MINSTNIPAALRNARVEFYDNTSEPGWGKTQYGLVISRHNGSGGRHNINFEKWTDNKVYDMVLDRGNAQEYAIAVAVYDGFKELKTEMQPFPDTKVFQAPSQHNVAKGGTNKYKLEPDLSVWATLVVVPGEEPYVTIYWYGEHFTISELDWIEPLSAASYHRYTTLN